MTERTIIIVDYDPTWSDLFDRIAAHVSGALGELAIAVHHVGSTSVPGLAAKPIIDLDVVIASRAELPAVVECLASIGYAHRGDLGIAGREAFARVSEDPPCSDEHPGWPAHHLYVCAADNAEVARHLAFRNWLRTHPADARAYAALKRTLAKKFPHDIDAYIEGKGDMIRAILARAAEEIGRAAED